MDPKRKLAAILFVDIAGYTDRSSRDESGALQSRERVEQLVKSATLSHQGRIVKTMGDGAMVEFASAVTAVSCALEIQEHMEALNAELQLADPIRVRIGVHVGDVVEEDNDLYGNAVNIASRVHAMAQPGGVCITREVYVQIRPILKLEFAPVAGSASSRMPEAVEVFQIVGTHPSTPARAKSRVLALAGLGVLCAVLAVAAIFLSGPAVVPPDPVLAKGRDKSRLLLPDWVTPGEWFAVGGDRDLTVYFGDRAARTRMDGGRLLVQAPMDLPTQQTTISVFEGDGREPLMRQQTQVIRPSMLASNVVPSPSSGDKVSEGSPAGPAPSSEEQTKPSGPASSVGASPTKTGSAVPASSPPGTLASSKEPDKGNVVVVRVPPPAPGRPAVLPPELDAKLLSSVVSGDGQFSFTRQEMAELRSLGKGPMRVAVGALSNAKQGELEEARKALAEAREELWKTPGIDKTEIEAILKMVEAITVEPMKNPGESDKKWAEAFAFSMNHGARNYAGLAMVSNLIRQGRHEDARRALALIRQRPDLTEQELKAVEQFESKLRSPQKPPTPPASGRE